MKTKNVILITLLFVATISVVCLNSCKKDPVYYTIKGHLYRGENKIPFRNQEFEFRVYRKRKIFEHGSRDYIFEKALGRAETNENGYIEFKYKHQAKGEFILMAHDIVATFENIDSRIPANQNIERDFFPPPSCGYADIFVNTNNILNAEDTLFIRYETLCGQFGSQFDTIYGNHTGYFKTINARRIETKNHVDKEIIGIHILAGKNRHDIGDREINYDYHEIFPINFPVRNTQQKDSIFIDYEVE